MRSVLPISKLVCFVVMMFLSLLISCDTENNIDPPFENYFVKYFGGDGDQTAVDFVINNDNSVIILGNSSLDATSGNKVLLIKADEFGNTIWEKSFANSNDLAKDIEVTREGNLVVLMDRKISQENSDLKLVRISIDGNLIDSVTFGTSKIESAQTVTPLSDGGFIVTGSTGFEAGVVDPSQADQSDIFHFRCDASLRFDTVFWRGQFGSGPIDLGTKVVQYASDIFYVFGTTNQVHDGNKAGNKNLFYYAIDAGGVNGTPNFLGDADNQTESKFVLQVPDALGAGYLIAGTESTSSGSVAMHVAKLRSPLLFDAVNDELFDRNIGIDGRNLTLQSAAAALNGGKGYLLLANEERETANNIWITKIDQSGNQLWSVEYGSEEEDDQGSAIAELQDGKILVLGSVRLINNQNKIVLMKLNSSGQLMK